MNIANSYNVVTTQTHTYSLRLKSSNISHYKMNITNSYNVVTIQTHTSSLKLKLSDINYYKMNITNSYNVVITQTHTSSLRLKSSDISHYKIHKLLPKYIKAYISHYKIHKSLSCIQNAIKPVNYMNFVLPRFPLGVVHKKLFVFRLSHLYLLS